MKISWVLAVSIDSTIGQNNKIPWKLQDDMKLFRETTLRHHVLMGRKTFESIGKPLPNRVSLVVTRDLVVAKELYGHYDNVHFFGTIESAVDYARKENEEELMIIGGAQIYEATRGLVDKVYLTRVEENVEGDAHFRFVSDQDHWKIVGEGPKKFEANERNQYPFTYAIYARQ